MNLDDYQKISIQGLAIKNKSVAALAHRSLGLAGEAGAISNAMKKVIRDSDGQLSEKDKALLLEKLGDTMFYIVGLADFAGLSMKEIMSTNADKTKKFIKTRQI